VFDDFGVIGRLLEFGVTHLPHRRYRGAEVLAEVAPEADRGVTPDVPYPTGLMIPQWRVEQTLRQRLADFGVAVELGRELRDLRDEQSDGVTATVGDTRIPGVRLRDLTWRSTYRVNVRMVDRLRVGRVFLAGDAAHVHPIAGGLGMNSGIQDAYNLGWKLGLVLAGAAAPDLLDTYGEERLPIASWLLNITSEVLDAVLAAITESGGGLDAGASTELTQLQLGYWWSRLSHNGPSHNGPSHNGPSQDGASRAGGLRAGDRAPDAPCRDPRTGAQTRLFDLFRGPHFTLLGLGERCAAALEDSVLPDFSTAVVRSYPIGPAGLADDGGHAARAYGEEVLVLVRPDGYVGLIADADDAAAVAGYLRCL
jgi:hypothetical protein